VKGLWLRYSITPQFHGRSLNSCNSLNSSNSFFVICHFLCSAAVGLLDRFIHDLASMRYHAGLKDFVIKI
jgi:hypothetical protein